MSPADHDHDQERRPSPDRDRADRDAGQPGRVQVEVPPVGDGLDHDEGGQQRDRQQLDEPSDPRAAPGPARGHHVAGRA